MVGNLWTIFIKITRPLDVKNGVLHYEMDMRFRVKHKWSLVIRTKKCLQLRYRVPHQFEKKMQFPLWRLGIDRCFHIFSYHGFTYFFLNFKLAPPFFSPIFLFTFLKQRKLRFCCQIVKLFYCSGIWFMVQNFTLANYLI